MRELTIALDLSSSLVKAIYTTDAPPGEMKLFTLPVEVIAISPGWIEAYRKTGGPVLSETDEIHVKIGRSHYAVGRLAGERFAVSDSLREVKAERGIVRTVAAVGAIASREKIPESFRLNLGVLLPYGEINDREIFGREVGAALKEFGFRGREYRVEVSCFSCLPEGSGVLLRGKTIERRLGECELLALSLGYRNASYLLFRSGKIVEGGTTGLGFHALLEDIVSMTSGLKVEDLLPLVLKYKEHKRRKLPLRELIKSEADSLRKIVGRNENLAETYRGLLRAIQLADEGYWLALSDWLKTRRFPKVDEVIVTGGTADYLRDELESYFRPNGISWGDNIERIVRSHLVSEGEYGEKYRYRLTDNCGFFFVLKYDTLRRGKI